MLLAVCGIAGLSTVLLAQVKAPAVQLQTRPGANLQPASAEQTLEAGIKSITDQYVKAFNARDAGAAAALWTENGEFIGEDGVTIRGRAAIEKSFAEEFKASPKAILEVRLDSVRPLGRHTAMAEGTTKLKTPGNSEAIETKYSALHVLEDGKWLTASVREWSIDPGTEAGTKFLDWHVGQWTAKGHRGDVSITYAWDENKKFLHGTYSITKDGKVVASGTHILGLNPSGGLRSWSFDSSGAFSNANWIHEGNRWIEESTGTLSNGAASDSISVVIPLGADAYCWQTIERTVDGVQHPPMTPIKVSRVKTNK
jgi:uncharacterized protein (TIGR02246 family)